MPKAETCLVTGCAGFIGSHLSERLLDKGHHVVGLDTFFSGKQENMAPFKDHERFHFHELDIRAPSLLRRLTQEHSGLSRLFHLAAIVSVPYSVNNPWLTMETNYVCSLALFEEARQLGFVAAVFAGSAAEYGNIEQLPLKEDAVSRKEARSGLANLQESPYGVSKFLTSRYIETHGFGCSLRFFNIYGPRQDPASPYSGVISRFVDQALRGAPLTIQGDGKQTRDFIYVSDVVDAYLLAAGMQPEANGPASALRGVYNVGSQTETSIQELAETITSLSGSNWGTVYQPPRAGDIRRSVADIGKFRQATGFTPRTSLEDGLRRLLHWTKKQESA